MRKFARGLLVSIGAMLLLCAFLSGIAALTALVDRLKHGRGLMFADVEFFALVSVVLGATGGFVVWLGLRLKTGNHDSESGTS